MTTLLPPSNRSTGRSSEQVREDLATRRPLVLLATAGGVAAAAATLLVCAGDRRGRLVPHRRRLPRRPARRPAGRRAGVADGPRLRRHASRACAVTAMPLGITLLCAWVIWRTGHRVGVSVSGHGPDAVGIDDGQHDLVVPWTALLFTTGYVVTAVATLTAGGHRLDRPEHAAVVLWSLLLCGLVGVPAIAVGSGRAAIWTARIPATARGLGPRRPPGPRAVARGLARRRSWSPWSSTSPPRPT